MKENSAESRPWYGGRGAVIQTLRKKAARSPKEFFSALWASLWSKNKGGGGGGGLPGPLPWIRHWISLQWCMTCVWVFSLFFRHGNETRLTQIDDKPFTSHPPHETDHTTGVYTLVFSKRCGLFCVLSDVVSAQVLSVGDEANQRFSSLSKNSVVSTKELVEDKTKLDFGYYSVDWLGTFLKRAITLAKKAKGNHWCNRKRS